MVVFFSEKYAEVTYDEVNRVVIITPHGYMSSEQFRLVTDKTLECMVKYKTVKNLSDLRTFMTIRPDDQEWVAKDWNPRAIKALGKIKSAVILPPNMIQKQALENVSSKNQKELSVTGTFGTVEEAIAWLRK